MKVWLNSLKHVIMRMGEVLLCLNCPCDEITPGCGCDDLPDIVRITITGVTNGAGCSDCAEKINGTYEVPITNNGFTCLGVIHMDHPDCFDCPDAQCFGIQVQIVPGTGSFTFDVKIFDGDSPESFRTSGSISGSNCCAVLENVTEYFGPVKDCDWSAATVTAEAVCL